MGRWLSLLHGGNDAEVERVAGVVGEGAHAAFAEDDLVVALAHDVFGGHQEFFERGGHAALQQHGLAQAAGALEQREVLHVAGADLDHVGLLVDQFQRFVVDGFGDDAHSEVVADFGHDLQGFDAEALKCVGRGARLVGAAAEELRTGAATCSAMAKACSRLSMAHGPATMARLRPPMVASVPGKRMTVFSSLTSRLTSL